jgi:hypothetical protein
MRAATLIASFLGCLLTGGAGSTAQDVAPDILQAQLGEWLAVPDDGERGCRIRLTDERTIGGRRAIPDAACAARIPRLAEAAAWSFAEGLTFTDATRRRVMTFVEDETTLLKTRGDKVPNYMLVRAKPGVERAPHAPAIVGTWILRRPEGPTLCTITFSDRPPLGAEESFALRPEAGCDSAVARLKLASWRIEDFALMLYGDGGSLRFEPGPGGFDKAEGGKPLQMVRRP